MEISAAKQHPFSLYDFIGYLMPGMYLICSILFFDYFYLSPNGLVNFFCGKNFSYAEHFGIIFTILFIFSYVAGHIIAIFSNLIIEEYPYVENLGRPIEHLLGLKKNSYQAECIPNAIFKKILFPLIVQEKNNPKACCLSAFPHKFKFFTNLIFWFIPLGFPSLIFIIFFSPSRSNEDIDENLPLINNFHKFQPLGDPAIAKKKISEILSHYFKIEMDHNSEEASTYQISKYFNYLLNIVLRKCPAHIGKIHNYVALYGFMRNMLMANLIVFFFLLISFFGTHKWELLYSMVFIIPANVFFLYGYLKYTRRYAEEIIFAACTIDLNNKNCYCQQ